MGFALCSDKRETSADRRKAWRSMKAWRKEKGCKNKRTAHGCFVADESGNAQDQQRYIWIR